MVHLLKENHKIKMIEIIKMIMSIERIVKVIVMIMVMNLVIMIMEINWINQTSITLPYFGIGQHGSRCKGRAKSGFSKTTCLPVQPLRDQQCNNLIVTMVQQLHCDRDTTTLS